MNYEKFEVGEVAVIAFSNLRDFPVGCEVTILGPLEMAPCGMSHHVGWRGPDKVMARPSSLRKRRPPPAREQTSTWDDVIVWRPKTKETSHV